MWKYDHITQPLSGEPPVGDRLDVSSGHFQPRLRTKGLQLELCGCAGDACAVTKLTAEGNWTHTLPPCVSDWILIWARLNQTSNLQNYSLGRDCKQSELLICLICQGMSGFSVRCFISLLHAFHQVATCVLSHSLQPPCIREVIYFWRRVEGAATLNGKEIA